MFWAGLHSVHSCMSWNDTTPDTSTHPAMLWTGLDHVTGVIRLPCCSTYVHVASGLILQWDVKHLAVEAARVSPGQNARLPLCPWVVSIPVCTVRWWSVCLQWPAWGPSHLPNVAFTPPPVYPCVCERKSVSTKACYCECMCLPLLPIKPNQAIPTAINTHFSMCKLSYLMQYPLWHWYSIINLPLLLFTPTRSSSPFHFRKHRASPSISSRWIPRSQKQINFTYL